MDLQDKTAIALIMRFSDWSYLSMLKERVFACLYIFSFQIFSPARNSQELFNSLLKINPLVRKGGSLKMTIKWIADEDSVFYI